MEQKDLFETFNLNGKLSLQDKQIDFSKIKWSQHATFEGVALKHIVTSKDTDGKFSFHLVKVEPNKKIGNHVHKEQLETHEVIKGSGTCINNGVKIEYTPGVISIIPRNIPHEVIANKDGLYMFAKFIPALL